MKPVKPNIKSIKTSKLPLKEDMRKYNGGHKTAGAKPKYGKDVKIKRIMVNIPEKYEAEIREHIRECLKKYEI